MFTIIGSDGKEYGPVTADQIKQWLAENRLTREMKARRDGEATWQRIGDLPELAPPGATAPLPQASPASAPADGTAAPDASAATYATTPSPAAPAAATPLAPEPLVFTGNWQEYFKIWIVNVLLTIVTLGIYAAWAKVRKRRYFYANTRAFGHTFEYLADPVKILYGNLIVGGLFLVLTFSQVISPVLYLGFVLVFSIAVPWFIVRALAFNARNTAWRGLRFNFGGTYGAAARAFLLWPLLVPFTLGFLFPFVARKQKELIVNRHAFGTSPFSLGGTVEGFYKIYGIAVLFFLPIIVLYFAVIFMVVARGIPRLGGGTSSAFFGLGGMELVILVAIPLAIAGTFYFRSRMFNYLWNHTAIAGNRFAATMRARDLFLLHFVNSLVTLLTVGLMHPWAAVRSAKFQLDSVRVLPAGNVDAFVAAAQPPVGAVGEAASDFFDFDIGFGV